MPQRDFLSAFEEFASQRTNAPVAFHRYAAVSVAGAALGNRLFLDAGWGRIYPSMWTCFIGRSGVRKSTAVNLAAALLAEADESAEIPHDFSREAFYEILAARPYGLLRWREMGSVLKAMQRDYACVDDETECFTREGWKRHDAVHEGDEILTLARSGLSTTLHWDTVQRMHRYDVQNETLLEFTGRSVSMLVTPNHQMVLHGNRKMKRADSIGKDDDLLQVARWGAETGNEVRNKALAGLVGWYVTEGWDDGEKIMIAQKSGLAELMGHLQDYRPRRRPRSPLPEALRGHRKQRKPTRRLVFDKNDDISVRPTKLRGMHVFCVQGATAAKIRKWAPDKHIRFDALWRWPRASLQALFDALIDGDGWRSGRSMGFAQKDRQRCDFMQALALRLGYRSVAGQQQVCQNISFTRNRGTRFPRSKARPYTGTIWCPQTASETWVTRRRGRICITGNSGTLETLTDFWDSPTLVKRRTKGSGEVQIHRPAVSILAAAKPRWFVENVRADLIEGGFLSRWLLIMAEENNGYGPFFGTGHNSSAAAQQRASLVDHLRKLTAYEGQMFPGEGAEVLEAWLKRWDASGWDEDNDPADMASRAGTHVVKLAMGLQACRGTSYLLELHPKAVEVAIGMWEYAYKSAQPLVMRMHGRGLDADAVERVAQAIKSSGRISQRELLRRTKLTKRKLMEYVETLLASEQVRAEPIKNERTRSGIMYYWTG